jgi:Zn-dependent protease with chaperone function
MVISSRRILLVSCWAAPIAMAAAALHAGSGLGWPWSLAAVISAWACFTVLHRRSSRLAGQWVPDERVRQAVASLPATRVGQIECGILDGGKDGVALAASMPSARPPRVFVNRKMLEIVDDWQLRSIVAHEVAHVEQDKPHGLLVLAALESVLAALAGVWAILRHAASGADAARWIALIGMGACLQVVAVRMLLAAESRWQERRATVRAIELTGDGQACLAAARAIVEHHGGRAIEPGFLRRLAATGLSLGEIEAIVRQTAATGPQVQPCP